MYKLCPTISISMFQTNAMIKLGFLGQSGVGKSHLIHRYLINSLPQKLTSTIAVQFATGFYKMEDGTKLKIKIWDTSGQDKYKQIVSYHLKEVQALVIVYDITSEKSFSKVDQWLERVEKEEIEDVLVVLVGNKNDLKESRKVSAKRGEEKAKEIGAEFYQLNSFDTEDVKDVFAEIIETVIEKRAEEQIKEKKRQQLVQQENIEKSIKTKRKELLLPIGIEDSGAADAICSNCAIY